MASRGCFEGQRGCLAVYSDGMSTDSRRWRNPLRGSGMERWEAEGVEVEVREREELEEGCTSSCRELPSRGTKPLGPQRVTCAPMTGQVKAARRPPSAIRHPSSVSPPGAASKAVERGESAYVGDRPRCDGSARDDHAGGFHGEAGHDDSSTPVSPPVPFNLTSDRLATMATS